jgi:transaldolase
MFRMRSLRDNWVAIVVLAAIFLSFFIGRHDAIQRDNQRADEQRKAQVAQIAGCQRNTERGVLFAAYQQRTSDVRRAAGEPKDIKAADEYQAFSLGGVEQLTLPVGFLDSLKVPTHTAVTRSVDLTTNKRGERVYRLKPMTKKVIKKGCIEAYG